MEHLLIRLPPDTVFEPQSSVTWQVLDSDFIPVGQTGKGALVQASEVAHHRKVFVLAPSEDILLSDIHLEARNRQQLLKAIPYALEDELAEDVESLHFAPAPSKVNGAYPVAVVSRARMDSWLHELEEAKIVPHMIFPEVLSLPFTESNWSILLEKERVLVRNGNFAGFSADSNNFETLINLALEEAQDNPPQQIDVYRCDPSTTESLAFSLPLRIEEHFENPLALMATGLDTKRNINLLQCSYEIGSKTSRMLRPWRVAAVLLGIWLCLGIVSVSMDYWRLSRDDRILKTHIENVFKATFPDVRRIVNPRVQMEQKLNALLAAQRGDRTSEFLELLNATGQAIAANPGVNIESLSFRQSRLEIRLSANGLQALDKIKQQIQSDGHSANIESAETSGQKVDARITIQRS